MKIKTSKSAIRIAFDSHGHRLSTIPLATPAAAVTGAVWLLLGVSQCHVWYLRKNPRSSKCKVKRFAYLAVNRILIFRDNNQSNFNKAEQKWKGISFIKTGHLSVPKSWECYNLFVPNSRSTCRCLVAFAHPSTRPTGAPQCQKYPVEHLLGSLAPHDLARSPWCSELFPSNGRKQPPRKPSSF